MSGFMTFENILNPIAKNDYQISVNVCKYEGEYLAEIRNNFSRTKSIILFLFLKIDARRKIVNHI